ncbi:peptidyl-prolyl cis-trans isomerase, partial [candidate division KSB1 bacterium]|nr:peptidyl-prolyl cis-trans isomerase [candidate division KSB1 bacterium]
FKSFSKLRGYMKLSLHLLGLFILLVLICIFACEKSGQQNQNIIAEIGDNYTISFDDLRTYVTTNFYNKMYRDQSEAYHKALDVMVINQLKRIDFVAKNLQDDENLLNSFRRTINEELIVKYFNSQFLGKYTSDEYVQETYQNMAKEVIYKQIVLYKPENATENDILDLKKKVSDIKTEIDQGKNFSEMVHLYSQHAESAENDGLAPPLRWKNRIANNLFNYIFFQPVNVVLMLETDREFYIVKITEINELDVEPLEKLKKEIISDLEKDYLEKSLEEYDKMKEKLVNESSLIWNQKAFNQILNWSKVQNFNENNYKKTIEQAITNGENPVILKYSDQKIDVKEYLRLLDEILLPTGSVDITEKNIKDYIVEAVRSDIVVKKAKGMNLDKDIFDPNTPNTVIQYKMVQIYNQVFIDSQVPEPSDMDLQKFYEEQKDSLFYQLAKVNIHAFVSSNKAEVDKMWENIKQGKTFNEVTKNYLVKTFIKTRDGQIKSYLSPEPPFMGEAAFRLNESQTDGVIEFNDPEKGKQFAIIKCTHLRPEKQLAYVDVQSTIRDEYRKFMKTKIETQVEHDLLERYPIKIYRNVLKNKIAAK